MKTGMTAREFFYGHDAELARMDAQIAAIDILIARNAEVMKAERAAKAATETAPALPVLNLDEQIEAAVATCETCALWGQGSCRLHRKAVAR